MTSLDARPSVMASWFEARADVAGDVGVALVTSPLREIDVVDGCLVGAQLRVSTRAVLVDVDADGALRGMPVEPIALHERGLCFDPSKGGVRTRENRRARGAFNTLVAEANRFGMVNSFVHTQRAAALVNGYLADLGAPRLPSLHVVVGAHSGSKLPGYASGDGDERTGELRPLSGGHYRLSARTTHVPEHVPVDPLGEVHLGPSRYRKPYADSLAYLRNAAHNPAIVYHEFGHHLCRHTADFRLNAERRPQTQRNGKTGVEEGVCDYLAAALLGSGRPYGWYRADRGRRRDPEARLGIPRHTDDTTAHQVGATWASAWWACRRRLVEEGHLSSGVDHDRVLIAALVAVGEVGRGGKRGTRDERERVRSADATMASQYLGCLHEAAGPKAVVVARALMETHGLLEDRVSCDGFTC